VSQPLKFRTSGFPRYGLKASLSDGAFPRRRSVKLAPSIPVPHLSLPPPFVHALVLQLSPIKAGVLDVWHAPLCERLCRSTPGVLAPVRVMLSRSIFTSSTPSAPLAGTSRLHGTAAYTRRLRCTGAPRRPTSGSELSLSVPSRHVILRDPGKSAGCLYPVPSPATLIFTHGERARHFQKRPFRGISARISCNVL
jgi:hypothetical protein